MNTQPCLSTIKTEYARLTKRERKLADYILENFESVVTMSTTELAQNAGVVRSVIIRFCHSLGFGGYTEFKLMLSRELARNEQFGFTPYISKDNAPKEILGKIFASNIKTLHDTAEGIDTEIFTAAVDALYSAHSIYVYGIGTSAGIACDFQYRLTEIGLSAFFFTDVANMRVSALNIREGDAAIGISNSGRTAATADALALAREHGAKTVCVTSYPKCELVKNSDYPIVIKTDEIQYPTEGISARIAHISVLDSLAVSLSAKDFDRAVRRSAKIHDLIDELRY